MILSKKTMRVSFFAKPIGLGIFTNGPAIKGVCVAERVKAGKQDAFESSMF